MTREETKKLIMIIAATYPNYKPENASAVIDAWHLQLAGEEYQRMQNALVAYNRTNLTGFAPSIGQLLDCAYNLENNDLTEMEAWNLVRNRLSSSAYYSQGNWETLPEIVRKVVTPEQLRSWATDDDFNEGVAQSNFCRSYREEVKRKKEAAQIPAPIRTLIGKTAERLIEDEYTREDKRNEPPWGESF